MYMKKILLAILTSFIFSACDTFTVYDGPACFSFDATKSSPTTINELGEMEAEYYVHYIGPMAEQTNTVTFSVISGDGLKEGLDFQLITSSYTLSFLTGFTDLPIRIKWLPNTIDPNKDNSLTIVLESVDNPDAIVGLPGPDQKNRTLKIFKYKN